MITDGEKWYYLAKKSFPKFNKKIKKSFNLAKKGLSELPRGFTSNHDGDFYCLNCFHSYSTEKRLEKHEKECFNYDDCPLEMSN